MSIGSAAASMYGSYQQGKAEQMQAETNAQIYEAQAKNIRSAQRITDRQYRTKANVLRGQATATAARNGLRISGTTANSISQSIMELQMDNSYEQYNLELERHNAFTNAMLQRYQGKMARTSGMMQAGQTALNMGADLYGKYWKNDTSNTNTWNWNGLRKNARLSGGFATTNQQTLDNYKFA